jgi:hypothetical protein
MTRFQVYKTREAFGFTIRSYYCSATDREHAEQMRALCDDPARGYRGEIVPVEIEPTFGERWVAA